MNRPAFTATLTLGLLFLTSTAIHAQANRVHIAPTAMVSTSTSIEIASDSWAARGYDLKSLLAEIYDVDARRIDLPQSLSGDQKFDVTLALPQDESEDAIRQLLRKAIEVHFNLTITPESRSLDVYVLTTPAGPGPSLHPHPLSSGSNGEDAEALQKIAYEGRACPGISSGGISVSAVTISEFRRTFEPTLDRLLISETNLPGTYDFQIAAYRSKDELFQLLRNQLGLVVTPARRTVTVFAVRPASARNKQVAAL